MSLYTSLKCLNFLFSINFNWRIVALQCCVSFRCTAKWISEESAYIPSALDSSPFRSPQGIEESFLSYAVGIISHLFYTSSVIYVNPSLPIHPPLGIHNLFSTSVTISVLQISSSVRFFLGGGGCFPGGTTGKEPACQCRRPKRLRFDLWVGKIPWRRAWQTTPLFLPGESHGWRSLAGYSL